MRIEFKVFGINVCLYSHKKPIVRKRKLEIKRIPADAQVPKNSWRR